MARLERLQGALKIPSTYGAVPRTAGLANWIQQWRGAEPGLESPMTAAPQVALVHS